MAEQPYLFGADSPWIPIRDGNPTGMSIFMRHYTARDAEKSFNLSVQAKRKFLLRRTRRLSSYGASLFLMRAKPE